SDSLNVRLYYSLLDEYEQNMNLYKAFLEEYQKSLDELHVWADGLPQTPEDDAAVREQWRRYVKQFEDDIETELSILRSAEDWEARFRDQTAQFILRYNYS